MGVLQKEFDRVFKELCRIDSLRVMLVRRVAETRGLKLTEEQIQTLAKSISDGSRQNEGEVELDGLLEDIEITTGDLEGALKTLEEDIEGHAERSFLAALDELPPGILKSLYEDVPDALRHRRGLESQFRDQLFARWKGGLDRLEMLIMIAQEAGGTYIEDLNEGDSEEDGAEESPDAGSMLEALIALHARACRIASEVLCLLRGGFADGANARWRSLHEVAVTALFLTQHAGDIADRYIDHGGSRAAKSRRTVPGALPDTWLRAIHCRGDGRNQGGRRCRGPEIRFSLPARLWLGVGSFGYCRCNFYESGGCN